MESLRGHHQGTSRPRARGREHQRQAFYKPALPWRPVALMGGGVNNRWPRHSRELPGFPLHMCGAARAQGWTTGVSSRHDQEPLLVWPTESSCAKQECCQRVQPQIPHGLRDNQVKA